MSNSKLLEFYDRWNAQPIDDLQMEEYERERVEALEDLSCYDIPNYSSEEENDENDENENDSEFLEGFYSRWQAQPYQDYLIEEYEFEKKKALAILNKRRSLDSTDCVVDDLFECWQTLWNVDEEKEKDNDLHNNKDNILEFCSPDEYKKAYAIIRQK